MSALQLVRHASRSLRRTPVFTATAAATLVVGIGAAVAIFAVVEGVLLRPLPFGHPDRLVGAWHDLPPLSLYHTQQTEGTYATYRKLAHTIEDIGLYQSGAVNVAERGGTTAPQRLDAAWLTRSLIPVLEVPPALGRNFSEAEDLPNGPKAVIISDALWRTRFGADPSVVGKTLDVGGTTREIIGVMPPRFRFPDAATQLWLPLAIDPNNQNTGGFNYNSIARLKPGVSAAEAERDFTAVLPRMVEIKPFLAPGISTQMLLDQAKPRPVLVPLREDMTSRVARTIWMIAAAAGLVLLVACANVTNLVLVRADGRQRELAVREALGAGRARVIVHFLAESAVIAGLAAVVGLGLAALAVRALVSAAPVEIPRLSEVRVDGGTVLFALLVTLLVTFVCSAIPALRIGRVELSRALREGGRAGTAGRSQQRVRGALVAAQIALALVVLAGSGLLLRTFQRLEAVRPGFDPEHVATFWLSLPDSRYKTDSSVVRFYAELMTRAAALPGVRTAAITSRLPLEIHGMNSNPFYVEGDLASATKIPPLQLFTTVSASYFSAMGIPLIAGRTFEQLGVQRDGDAIISQRTAVQFFGDSTGARAIGKRFAALPGGPLNTIIGVVGSVRDTSLAAPPTSAVYFPQSVQRDTMYGQAHWTMALVLRTAGDPASLTRPVQDLVRDLDPTLPTFDVRPMSAVFRASMAPLAFVMLILAAAAVVTLLLGAIGLYGVMAYVVTLRTKEMSVRIALGAAPRSVAAMMTQRGIALTAAGVAGGLVLFAVVARFLRTFLYGVAPSDPIALTGAVALLLAIAALASWIPARRASRIDPAVALREG